MRTWIQAIKTCFTVFFISVVLSHSSCAKMDHEGFNLNAPVTEVKEFSLREGATWSFFFGSSFFVLEDEIALVSMAQDLVTTSLTSWPVFEQNQLFVVYSGSYLKSAGLEPGIAKVVVVVGKETQGMFQPRATYTFNIQLTN